MSEPRALTVQDIAFLIDGASKLLNPMMCEWWADVDAQCAVPPTRCDEEATHGLVNDQGTACAMCAEHAEETGQAWSALGYTYQCFEVAGGQQ